MPSFGVERGGNLLTGADMGLMLDIAHKTDGFDGLEPEDIELVLVFAVSHINFFSNGDDENRWNRFMALYKAVHKTEHLKTIAFQVSNRTLEALSKIKR